MDELTLIYPNKEHEAAAMEFAAECRKECKAIWLRGLFVFKSYDEWLEKIDDDIKGRKVSRGEHPPRHFSVCVSRTA